MTNPLYPCGKISRRRMLHLAGGGFFGAAMGALWSQAGEIQDATLNLPHFAPRAKSVIFLFMCGGVSHIDTFDPKGNKYAGKMIDVTAFGDNVADIKRPVIRCERKFTNYGKSGIPVSDWFPHIGSMVDDIAFVRSMWCNEGNHFPAVIETVTGHRGRQFDCPSLGSWVSYAARNREPEPSFLRKHRPAFITGATHRRIPRRRQRQRDSFCGWTDADSESQVAAQHNRVGSR